MPEETPGITFSPDLLELVVKVHVKVGSSIRLSFNKFIEFHLHPRHPLEAIVPVSIQASQPVVSTVLGVNNVQNTLYEVVFLFRLNICKISSNLIAALLCLEESLMVAKQGAVTSQLHL